MHPDLIREIINQRVADMRASAEAGRLSRSARKARRARRRATAPAAPRDGIVIPAIPDTDLAFENSLRPHELAPAQASLEQAFMELTGSSVEFRAGSPPGDGQQVLTGKRGLT